MAASSSPHRRLFVAAWLVGLAAVPAPASAYVCARVEDAQGNPAGSSLSWSGRHVTFALFAAGTADIAGVQELDVLRNSFRPWGYYTNTAGVTTGTPPQEDVGTLRSTDLRFSEASTLSLRDGVGYDHLQPEANENLLIFRDDEWYHGTDVLALTTTTYNAITGAILDADIEFNTYLYNFTITDTPTGADTDLMNTAVHEIGHLVGLDHSALAAATMASHAPAGETSKRVLHRDDSNAIVFKYPEAEANGYCDESVPGCSCTPPRILEADVVITGASPDDGLTGPATPVVGCNATAAASWVAPALLLPARRRRRARHTVSA